MILSDYWSVIIGSFIILHVLFVIIVLGISFKTNNNDVNEIPYKKKLK